jgi:hypothetical protein
VGLFQSYLDVDPMAKGALVVLNILNRMQNKNILARNGRETMI